MTSYLDNCSIVIITSANPDNSRFGTGFIIGHDLENKLAYVLTCTHVIDDVGGKDNVRVEYEEAEVIKQGNSKGIDIAVLASHSQRLVNQAFLPLKALTNNEDPFTIQLQICGYFSQVQTRPKREIEAKIHRKSNLSSESPYAHVRAWELEINEDDSIRDGYSGSPMIDKEREVVLGITYQREGEKKGFALSIDALKAIWPDRPANILPEPNIATQPNIDWGCLCRTPSFYGRKQDIKTLEKLVLNNKSGLIVVWGPPGIGKVSLVLEFGQNYKNQFDQIIARSLKSVPSVEVTLDDLIQSLSLPNKKQEQSIDQKLNQLISYLTEKHCLLILTSAEKVLCSEISEEYEQFFRRVGTMQNSSCLIITSQHKPITIPELDTGYSSSVNLLLLQGLDFEEAKDLLASKGITASDEELKNLIDYYEGNPCALQYVSSKLSIFNNDITQFLESKPGIIQEMQQSWEEQIRKLSPLEEEVMYLIAINNSYYSMLINSFKALKNDVIKFPNSQDLISAIQSLRNKSLINKDCYTQSPMVRDYLIEKLVEESIQEIKKNELNEFKFFKTYPFIKSQAEDFIREEQIHLIIKPIIEKLTANLENNLSVKEKLLVILNSLKEEPSDQGYMGGNFINLLCYLETKNNEQNDHLTVMIGYDFSNLNCRQSYLREVELHDVNFKGANLEKSVFRDNFSPILSLTFKQDGKWLVTGESTGKVCIWDVEESTKLYSYNLHKSTVWKILFSQDMNLLATCSHDQSICLLNAKDHQFRTYLQDDSPITALALSPNQSILASGGKTIKLWNIKNINTEQYEEAHCITLKGHQDSIHSLCFSPNGLYLASGSKDNTIKLWDIQDILSSNNQEYQEAISLSGHSKLVLSLAFSPDGKILASGSDDTTVMLWDVSNLDNVKHIVTLPKHDREVSSVVFSPNSPLLATSSHDKTIKLWNIQTPSSPDLLKILKGHTSPIHAIDFSHDGKLLASSSDQSIKLWNVNSGQSIKTLQGYNCWINSISYSPDGKCLTAGGKDDLLRLWDIGLFPSDISPRLTVQAVSGGGINSISYNQTGKYIVVGCTDGTFRIWQIKNHYQLEHMASVKAHQSSISCVAFSPNSNSKFKWYKERQKNFDL